MVVSVGHKGRYVGVVGVWKTNKPAQPYELKYQLVELGEEFVTPKGRRGESTDRRADGAVQGGS